MKVALVFPACSRRGGVERVVWEAANHLRGRHEVVVVSREAHQLPEGVAHLVVADDGRGVAAPFRFKEAAQAVLRGTSCDVSVSYGSECPACDVAVVNSVHRAWLRHAGPLEVAGGQLPGWVRYGLPAHATRLVMERAYYRALLGRVVVPCAEQVGRDLEDLYRLPSARMVVVENGFSASEFSAERRKALRPKVREELGYGERDVVLLMVANEWRRKGLGTVLEAMALVGDPALNLLLVGKANPRPWLGRLDHAGMGRRVRYVGPSDDVGRLHAAADLFVLPTQYEAFCLAIVEALASGLPVITSDRPGASDTVSPGHNGLVLADPLDVGGLAVLLEKAQEPTLRAKLTEAAAPSVLPYRWDILMTRFEQILRDHHARSGP